MVTPVLGGASTASADPGQHHIQRRKRRRIQRIEGRPPKSLSFPHHTTHNKHHKKGKHRHSYWRRDDGRSYGINPWPHQRVCAGTSMQRCCNCTCHAPCSIATQWMCPCPCAKAQPPRACLNCKPGNKKCKKRCRSPKGQVRSRHGPQSQAVFAILSSCRGGCLIGS